jgi:class 3 adenylate cyclase
MMAPDPDRTPEGGAVPPEAMATGQRVLAAIVFTDTVGFSRLMSKDEELTLRLVARDLAYMKTTCEAFGGQVLKSTGDGLLMLFTSAVQAVACALEIQRDLQKQGLELPVVERLQHRIGIHLGDVFQNKGDVMGDGVNIAARLQTEAVPGGICLSNTVYDVVHNRLSFYVNELGARKLKNIGKVTAYQISPVGADGVNRYRMEWYRWKPMLWGAASLAALVLTLCVVFYLGMHRQWAIHHKGEPGSFTLIPISSSPAMKPVPVHPAVPTPASNAPGGVTEATQAEFQNAAFHYMISYDFDGMEAWIKGHDWPGKSSSNLAEVCPQLNHLVTWSHQQLQRYTAEQPLKVEAKERTFYYWPAPFGGVREKIVPKGVPPESVAKYTLVGPDQIAPMAMLGIMRELLKEDPDPPDALTTELEKEVHQFIETYHLVLPNRNGPATNAPPAESPVKPGP